MGNSSNPSDFYEKCSIQKLLRCQNQKSIWNGTVGPFGFHAGVDGQDLSNG